MRFFSLNSDVFIHLKLSRLTKFSDQIDEISTNRKLIHTENFALTFFSSLFRIVRSFARIVRN